MQKEETKKMDQKSPLSFTDGGPAMVIDTESSFWDWLSAAGACNPGAPAIQSVRQQTKHLDSFLARSNQSKLSDEPDPEPFTWTYAEINQHATRLASYLYARGLRPGDHLVVVLRTTPEWALFFWASARLGTTFVPLPPPSLGDHVLWRHFLTIVQPVAIVVQDVDSALLADQHLGARPSLRTRLICQPSSATSQETTPSRTEEMETLSAWAGLPSIPEVSESMPLPPAPPTTLQHINQVVFTSGSEGPPKPCPRTNALVKTQIAQYLSMSAFSWSAETRYLWLTPSFMVIGLHSALCAWQLGGCVVFRPNRWTDPIPVLEDIKKMRITHIWTIASRLMVLATALEKASGMKWRMDSLQIVATSGEYNLRRSLSYVGEKFRLRRHVLSLWGMSEGGPNIGWLDDASMGHERPVATAAEMVTVGRVMPGASIKIVSRHQTISLSDHRSDPSIVHRNVTGELHVASSATVKDYLNATQGQDFYDDATGMRWFKTGDLALMDVKGNVFILGRVRELIEVSAGTVIPAVADEILSQFFGVQVATAAVPETRSTAAKTDGSAFYVAVVKMGQKDIDAHVTKGKARLNEMLGTDLLPRDFIALNRLTTHETWPITATGKTSRKHIAEAALTLYSQTKLVEAQS